MKKLLLIILPLILLSCSDDNNSFSGTWYAGDSFIEFTGTKHVKIKDRYIDFYGEYEIVKENGRTYFWVDNHSNDIKFSKSGDIENGYLITLEIHHIDGTAYTTIGKYERK